MVIVVQAALQLVNELVFGRLRMQEVAVRRVFALKKEQRPDGQRHGLLLEGTERGGGHERDGTAGQDRVAAVAEEFSDHSRGFSAQTRKAPR